MLKIGLCLSIEANEVVWDEKGKNNISQIFIWHNPQYVKSIAFLYIEDGEARLSPIFGGQTLDATCFDTVTLDNADTDEYITKVRGVINASIDRLGRGLSSLTIETNKNTYGPFGDKRNTARYDDINFNWYLGHKDQFGGFYGTSSPSMLKSLGVYLKSNIQAQVTNLNRTQLPID
ncbi:unnamed protein product [Amaranthus hypochondriacus]